MQQSMLVYNTDWQGIKSFRMMPIDLQCPFNEVIYDPTTRVLAIISKEHKDKPQMFPKLDDKGNVIKKNNSSNKEEKSSLVEQRIIMDTYYEYYIDEHEDIIAFINYFANNNKHESLKILKI